MPRSQEKIQDHKQESSDSSGLEEQRPSFKRPDGIRGVYYHPVTQVILLGLVCFTCPGLFSALNGLGGGGRVDTTVSANANAALYATFAFAAFFSGSINNKLGPRLTLSLGAIGYPLYISAYLVLDIHPKAEPFLIAAGALLGLCAALLWCAQGSLMLSYATEDRKGRYISVFWVVFNVGAAAGAAVCLGQNFHSTANSVGNITYICFLVLSATGIIIPSFMADPNQVTREDGTAITTSKRPSWRIELYSLWVTLTTDPMIMLLFPMFLASNWYYTWQFNDYNGAVFTIRARSLNNLLYRLSELLGSTVMGCLLDLKFASRRARGFLGWVILICVVFIVNTWAYFYQRAYTRESVRLNSDQKIDIVDPGYVGRVWLYIFCGLLDSMWQTTTFWIIGAMSNDSSKLAHFAGFYKSIQSAGAAGAWRADAVNTPYMIMLISTWVLLVAGLLFALPVLHFRVKKRTDFADGTVQVHLISSL